VRVDSVRVREVAPSFKTTGYITARNHIDVSSEVMGRVIAITFESGQRVKAGDLLVLLDHETEKVEVKRASSRAAYLEKELGRLNALTTVGVSQSAIDSLQLDLDIAKQDIEVLESVISKKAVVAPFEGTLGIRAVHLGQMISPQDSIVTLSDKSTLYVDFRVPERFSSHIKTGTPVEIKPHAVRDIVMNGVVTGVDSRVTSNEHMINIRASFSDPTERLIHGMFSEVSIPTGAMERKIVVPEVSVVPATYGSSVFVVETENGRDRVYRRNVVTGPKINGEVIIESGLKSGEMVVLFGQNRLRDKLEVEVHNDSVVSSLDGNERNGS